MFWCYVFKTPSSGYCCMVSVRYTLWINNIYNLQRASHLYHNIELHFYLWVWFEHLDVQILLLSNKTISIVSGYIALTLKRESTQKVLIQYAIYMQIDLLWSSYDCLLVFQQFYNLISVTTSETEGSKAVKMTRITKKKAGSTDLPNITLCDFLKMAKEGSWWFIMPVSGCCIITMFIISIYSFTSNMVVPSAIPTSVLINQWLNWEMSYF